jgi:hypothetical protein
MRLRRDMLASPGEELRRVDETLSGEFELN